MYIKLTDFGFAKKYDPRKQENLSLGSPLYMAPELTLEKPYDSKVDIWATGAITFVLLSGQPPFFDKSKRPSKQGIYDAIVSDEPDYTKIQTSDQLVIDFLERCLAKHSSQRATVDELLNHPWIQNNIQANALDHQR